MKTIENKIDELLRRKYLKPKTRYTKRTKRLGLVIGIILISSMLVTANLVTIFWTSHNISTTGDINIDGMVQDPSIVYYDTTSLSGATTDITTLDVTELINGEEGTFTHTLDNQGWHNYLVTFDLSSLPDMTTGVWEGVTFEVREEGTAIELVELVLKDNTSMSFDYFYSVDSLFEQPDPDIDFPFNLGIDLETIYFYLLSLVVSEGSGTVTATPDLVEYLEDSVVSVEAVPDSGYAFSHFENGLTGSTNPQDITMTGDKTVQAFFDLLYRCGFWITTDQSITMNTMFIQYKIMDYSETTTNYELVHPSSAGEWDILVSDVQSITYTSDDIDITCGQDEQHKVVLDESEHIGESENYVFIGSFLFNSFGDPDCRTIWNYVDESNFWYTQISLIHGYTIHKVEGGTDTTEWTGTGYPTANHEYIIKMKVNIDSGEAEYFLDGISKTTVTL